MSGGPAQRFRAGKPSFPKGAKLITGEAPKVPENQSFAVMGFMVDRKRIVSQPRRNPRRNVRRGDQKAESEGRADQTDPQMVAIFLGAYPTIEAANQYIKELKEAGYNYFTLYTIKQNHTFSLPPPAFAATSKYYQEVLSDFMTRNTTGEAERVERELDRRIAEYDQDRKIGKATQSRQERRKLQRAFAKALTKMGKEGKLPEARPKEEAQQEAKQEAEQQPSGDPTPAPGGPGWLETTEGPSPPVAAAPDLAAPGPATADPTPAASASASPSESKTASIPRFGVVSGKLPRGAIVAPPIRLLAVPRSLEEGRESI